MMKIWKGKELEGVDKGVQTMFVSGSTLDLAKVMKYVSQNTDCKRVYLGGGRIDAEECYEIDAFMLYCDTLKIDVILETSLIGFLGHTDKELIDKVDKVIVRVMSSDFDKLSSTDQIKIDTEKNVYTVELEKMIHTDLANLDKDMFASDVLVYDESEENK